MSFLGKRSLSCSSRQEPIPEPVPNVSAGAGDGVGSSLLERRDGGVGLRAPPAIEWHRRKPSSDSEPSASRSIISRISSCTL